MKLADIPKEKVMFMNYPNIELLMTGLKRAYQDRAGLITLIYTDDSEESRLADFLIASMTCFEVVSFVQEGRCK